MSESSFSGFVPPVFSELPIRRSFIRRQPMMTIGIVIIVLLITFAVIGPWFVGDPRTTNPGNSFASPSWSHFFGTDMYGRDVFARAVNAARLDLWLGIVISVVATVIGSLIGLVAGYWGGWVDEVVMRLTDVTLAFPGFVLAILLVTVLGGSSTSVAIGVTVSFIPYFIRLTRAEVLTQRGLEYVDGAILAGNSRLRVALRHVLPNSLRPSLVQATLVAGWAITTVGGLAFLGIGIHPPTPEWGVMVAEGANCAREVFA
jgi:peptide/nickel transport system permease protein